MKSGDEIGPYRIIRLLGQGGMGAVYEVEHRDLGVRYALKAFTCERSSNAFLRKRFLTEGKLLARLNHPRIVKVFDLAVDARRGVPYFVMNLVLSPDGAPRTLEDLRKSGGVTEELAARWYADLAEGLAYVHANGVVHRDVKLENVLVDAEGHAVLSDFGVSRIFEERLRRDLRTTVTMVGIPGGDDRLIMGTKVYLAPEIRFGEKATPPSDWYALGVLMLRLLTGVWYGPDTDLEGLLAGFETNWTARVAPLLSIDPSLRRPHPPNEESCRLSHRLRLGRFAVSWKGGLSAALLVLSVGFLIVYEFFLAPSAPSAENEDQPGPVLVAERGQAPVVPLEGGAADLPGASSPSGEGGVVPSAAGEPVGPQSPQVAASNPQPAAAELPGEPLAFIPSASSTTIPRYAFAGRTELEAVVIPEGVTTIEEGAFIGSGLRSVRIPASVDMIDRHAFSACDNLSVVEFDGRPPLVDAKSQTFPEDAGGVYPAEWANQWQSVIDPETGKWMGLQMIQNTLPPP